MRTIRVKSGNGTYKVATADTRSELDALKAQYGGKLILLVMRGRWATWEIVDDREWNGMLNMPATPADTVIRYRKCADIEHLAYLHVVGRYNCANMLAAKHPDASIAQAIDILQTWQAG